ncbi:MAG: small multi-drug export protein [Clostridia bacterium]|nr:small multi-drug export protein [Clostridia bacterium]
MIEQIKEYLYVFFCSMLPIIELRGSIPIGCALGLPWYLNYIVSVVGNFLPVPFILLFIKKILQWMKTVPKFEKIALWVEKKAEKNTDKVTKYATFGLLVFVATPLPGTGAWTGALIAALIGMKFKYAMLSVAIGVLIAGFIMSGVSYGFLSFLSFFAN